MICLMLPGGWDPYNLHDLAHVSLGWVCPKEIPGTAEPLTTAGEELDDVDHDLSDLFEV